MAGGWPSPCSPCLCSTELLGWDQIIKNYHFLGSSICPEGGQRPQWGQRRPAAPLPATHSTLPGVVAPSPLVGPAHSPAPTTGCSGAPQGIQEALPGSCPGASASQQPVCWRPGPPPPSPAWEQGRLVLPLSRRTPPTALGPHLTGKDGHRDSRKESRTASGPAGGWRAAQPLLHTH